MALKGKGSNHCELVSDGGSIFNSDGLRLVVVGVSVGEVVRFKLHTCMVY